MEIISRKRKGVAAMLPAEEGGSALEITVGTDSPAGRPGLESVRDELAQILSASTSVSHARANLVHAEALARGYERDSAVRLRLLQIKERTGLTAGLVELWAELLCDRPADLVVVQHYASLLVKERREAEAIALVGQHIPEQFDDLEKALARAELLADIKAHAESDALFRRLIAIYENRNLRVAFAKRLVKRGLMADAGQVLEPVAHTFHPDAKSAQLAAMVKDVCEFYRRFESERNLLGQDIKVVAMKHAILKFRERKVAREEIGRPKSVALVTGNLGPGGAERQLTRLARHLQGMQDESLDGVEGTIGAVEVIVKQHAPDPRRPSLDFFLNSLLEAGVKVTEVNSLPAVSASHQRIEDADLLRMLGTLPAQVHYGVTRLAPYLRQQAFDVVSLWQDGTCLYGALAALLAGVPIIHLVFRGLPPNIRQDRHRPEYEPFYRAMADIPGVYFVSNSRAGAVEYAKWLGLPIERFRVLYNGVPEIDTIASPDERHKWDTFAERTSDATETIGGVFRLEPDKRPMLWVKLAHRYLKRRPYARFVIVGDGRFLENVHQLAVELGVADRLLLAGLSKHVGFWFSKMDVKLLLSKYEGLPNVLIEAQMLGVCVVSTPAGGAGECFIDGVTGHLLDCLENPDLEEACDKIASLIERLWADEGLKARGKQRARMLFSIGAMIEVFMALCFPSTTQAPDFAEQGAVDEMVKI